MASVLLRRVRPVVATAEDAPLPDSLMAPPEVHRERNDMPVPSREEAEARTRALMAIGTEIGGTR